MANQLTLLKLKELLHYDPETGVFTWLVSRGKRLAGERAGTIGKHRYTKGYRFIRIDGKSYRAHRLGRFYMTGEWPKDEVDHKNGIRDDNRYSNLRDATHAQNMQNFPVRSVLGFKGVKKNPAGSCRNLKDRYVARIRGQHIGSFDTAEEAHEAYVRAANQLFGEFARVG